MTARTWLAGVLGALAMFVWLFIAHGVIGLGESGIQQIPNEAPLLATMQSTIPAHGTYMFPNMDPKDQDANMKKVASGPSGLLVYFPTRNFSFPAALMIEYITQFVAVMIALYLLSLTRVSTFAGRVAFFALIGLCVACADNVSNWNWYGFSGSYTLAACFTGWVGYVLAGVVVAGLKVGGVKTT